jgi:hypothetical protein
MNDETVAALAESVGLQLAPERHAPVAELLETLARDAGATAEEVAAVEPASAFDPRWPRS